MCACAGWTTVRRNHASKANSCYCWGTKISRHGEIFFSKAICLALVTMTCQPLTRISDGSSRLPDPMLRMIRSGPRCSQAHANEFPNNVIAVWLDQIPCSRVQIPCSFEKIPCSVA